MHVEACDVSGVLEVGPRAEKRSLARRPRRPRRL